MNSNAGILATLSVAARCCPPSLSSVMVDWRNAAIWGILRQIHISSLPRNSTPLRLLLA